MTFANDSFKIKTIALNMGDAINKKGVKKMKSFFIIEFRKERADGTILLQNYCKYIFSSVGDAMKFLKNSGLEEYNPEIKEIFLLK